jgi:mercuric ion binding protein
MSNRSIAAIAVAGIFLSAHANEPQRTTLDVKGMHCATCPLTVKVILKRQPGVDEVKMDANKHTAEVKYDPAKTSPDRLAKVATEAGFPTAFRR